MSTPKTLAELMEIIRTLPPMTEDEKREQAICWAWGNVNCDRPLDKQIPRSVVEAEYDRSHPRSKP